MKTSTFLWLLCAGVVLLIAAAFVGGRLFEKTTALQGNLTEIADRVKQLETSSTRREERWGWVFRIGSRIPFVRGLICQ